MGCTSFGQKAIKNWNQSLLGNQWVASLAAAPWPTYVPESVPLSVPALEPITQEATQLLKGMGP